MKSEPWNWEAGKKPPFGPWDKVRILSHNYGEPIIRLLEIPGAFVPGLGDALSKLKGFYGADLNVSPVHHPHSLKPLHSAPGPLTSKSGDAPVYPEGFEASFTVAHNGKGGDPISLECMDLCLTKFVAGREPFFEYQLEAEEVIGAGPMEPLRFFVEVGSDGPGPARRILRSTGGGTEVLTARGANFFDTEPETYYTFSSWEAPQVIKATVTALDQGYYELCFRFF
jgi:hypothetical protein